MKYFIDQTIDLPWGNYDILSEDESVAFHVNSQLALGHQLSVTDKDGTVVGQITEELAAVPTYLVWEHGVHCGRIIRKLAFPKPKLVVDYKNWDIDRNLRYMNVEIKDKTTKQSVASIYKEKWHLTDHYVLDIKKEEEALTVLLLMLAVSAIKEEQRAGAAFGALF